MKESLKITHKKLIIIGSGPAGYTAAIYAARANLNPLLITGLQKGGQLTTTYQIENWPGDFEKTLGIDLMNRMEKHATQLNTEIIFDYVINIQSKKKIFYVNCTEYQYTCDAIIIATGSSPRYLGLHNEIKFLGKGISTCATCDGFFFKEKEVAIVGGGNTAIEETLYLSNIVKKIHLIHRNQTFRAENILIKRLEKKILEKKVILYTQYFIQEILENNLAFSGIKIQSKINPQEIKTINVSALFIAIGHTPNTEFIKNKIKLDHGYIKIISENTEFHTQTNIPGIFAAGDVADPFYRQAITSAGSGCMAALDAEKYINTLNLTKINDIEI
ncbi:thioredoxin-disulfide reductase [Buchnera aphidicola]|uniref:thioredoxin-disulfide reductase n=1 Tax=Buchnera aphidicola TaxID=9 RepID=UPI0034642FC0